MGPLKRKEDWPKRLDWVISSARAKKFSWGRHDCALFASECIKAMTGIDFSRGLRGKYRSAKGAEKALMDRGIESLEEFINICLGPCLENIKKAQRGDVVLVETPDGSAAGIVDLSGRKAAVAGKKGLVFIPQADWIRGWRV